MEEGEWGTGSTEGEVFARARGQMSSPRSLKASLLHGGNFRASSRREDIFLNAHGLLHNSMKRKFLVIISGIKMVVYCPHCDPPTPILPPED